MAKPPKEKIIENQLEIFDPVPAEIRGICITDFKIKDGDVTAHLSGNTLIGDVALITSESWKIGIAEWLMGLCGDDYGLTMTYITEAAQRARDRAIEREAMRNAASNVVPIPPGYAASNSK